MDLLSKISISFFSWISYFVSLKILYPTSINDSVIAQLSSTKDSTSNLLFQQLMWKWLWLVPLSITIYIFWDDIKNLFYKL
jgi:glucan phosphoethanolaminetransferase (alkaline phosphatase superfamily)